jgi:predicted nucleic acid-binding protein
MKFVKIIDEKDTPFIALSLELKIPLWTNDRKLISGIRAKGFYNIVTNEELLEKT